MKNLVELSSHVSLNISFLVSSNINHHKILALLCCYQNSKSYSVMKNHILFIQWDMGDNSIQFFIIIFFTQNLFLWCKGHINLFPSSETWEITLHQILQQIFFTLNHFLLWRKSDEDSCGVIFPCLTILTT
jgi:hypothetical protein